MNTPFPENQSTKLQGHYWLSGFWILVLTIMWMALTGLKHHFDSFHYQTVDGNYYSELSRDFLEGRQMTISGILNKEGKSFSPYPPGYPVLLALTNCIQPDPVLPDHIWLHGALLFILGMVWIRYLPVWPLVVFVFSDTNLELGTYSWSEFSFLVCLILVAILLTRTRKAGHTFDYFLLLTTLILSSNIRYAAVFQIPVLSFLMVVSYYKDRTHSVGLFWVLLGYVFFLSGFAVWEWITAGQVTGGDRYPNTDGSNELFQSLITETINQLMIIKDMSGSSSFSFRVGIGAMVLLAFLLYRHFKKQPAIENVDLESASPSFSGLMSFHLLLLGLGYLAFIIPTRWYFYFAESFDLRLLGPGFGLIWLSFFTFLSGKSKKTPRLALFLFLGFALFFTLPKKTMFDAYQEKFWLRTGPVFPSR